MSLLHNHVRKGLMENQINNTSNMSKTFLSSPVVSNKTLTHSEDIFDLSSLGGKVVSKVNYTYSYWLAPEYYQFILDYLEGEHQEI